MNTLKRKSAFCAASLKALPLALALAAGAAHAEDASNMFSYSGFGTVGATHSSSTDGDYVGTLYQTSGAGATRTWDMGVDSKLGVQVNAKFTDQLSAVVQVVAMDRTDDTFGPRFEWANLQYAITPDLKVRVGRTALPTYMVSDTRMVGYSNPWVRAPLETYNLLPLTNVDGADLSYKARIGSVNNTVQVLDGRTSIDIVAGDGTIVRGITARQLEGINDSIEVGALTIRAGYTRSNVDLPLAPGYAIDFALKLLNIGAVYDPGTWFVQGEFSRTELPSLQPTEKAYYLTAGYRLGSFTPYATYSKVSPDQGAALVSYDQKTTSVGVRWDAMKNTDVKLQLDRVSLGNGNTGYFTNVQPALAGSTVNVVSVAVDFVF